MNIATYSQPTQAILRDELNILSKRLQEREDNSRIAAAEAIPSGKDADADALIHQIREIYSIRSSVLPTLISATHLLCDGQRQPNSPLSGTTDVVLSSHGLRVTVNGRGINGRTGAAIFANAIREIGFDRVAELGLSLNYHPLVSKELHKRAHQRYQMQVERREEWFIVTHSNTQTKRQLLVKICRRLGLKLSIDASVN